MAFIKINNTALIFSKTLVLEDYLVIEISPLRATSEHQDPFWGSPNKFLHHVVSALQDLDSSSANYLINLIQLGSSESR